MKKTSNSPFEIIHPDIQRGQIQQAVFDFDGTLSLIREGWQEVMVAMMVAVLMEIPGHEPEHELAEQVREAIDRLTGKQTIYQMIYLAEAVQRRGGRPETAEAYKRQFLEGLDARVADRKAKLENGRFTPQDLMVPDSVEILEALKSRGVTCTLASGTDDGAVKQEAEALGIAPYFVGIYGARDDYVQFSKKMVINSILAENHFDGPELVVFGDGYAEIEDAHAAGAIAVGVASDETTRQRVNPVKRAQLIEAGADLIISDYVHQEQLITYLFDELELRPKT